MMKQIKLLILSLLISAPMFAQESSASKEKEQKFKPQIHGSIRGKFEYQPEINQGRFQVRNARMNVSGYAYTEKVFYKAEIDFSDQGVMRMLDAYVRLIPVENLKFSIGQMRVPFSIDAHRSPYARLFANRSFIGKQVGDIRDVGAVVAYNTKLGDVPIVLEGGVFNGEGISKQMEWQSNFNSSIKAQFMFFDCWNVTLSDQVMQPDLFRVNMFDIGTYYKKNNIHVELEYLYKTYENNSFGNVHSIDAFAMYNVPIRGFFKNISFLARYDMMSDHSDGVMTEDEINGGFLAIDDAGRQRVTGGITLSLVKKLFVADLRFNYEKYFYKSGATMIDPSEKDKLVVELVCKF